MVNRTKNLNNSAHFSENSFFFSDTKKHQITRVLLGKKLRLLQLHSIIKKIIEKYQQMSLYERYKYNAYMN